MNYTETLNYLYTQLPMYQRVGSAAFKKDLTNILALCEALGNPHEQYPTIHIAGTNGKGSTTHLTAAALIASGKKVGIYTSPHYKDFRERIKIGNQYISKKAVVAFVAKHQALLERIRPSFFEITVALAFHYFAQQKVDIAIIEVGLGGRLDSTNIITPLLSVITNISLDHQQFLGNTIPAIASEKAGIIKDDIPVIIGETQTETTPVFTKKAASHNAPIEWADKTYKLNIEKETLQHIHGNINGAPLDINLSGPFQAKNIVTAYATLQKLITMGWLEAKGITNGWADLKTLTRFLGRWQVLSESPTIICDSAHNEAGLTYTLQRIAQMPFERLHIVLGVVNDKEIDKILKMFPTEATYYFAKANIPRGLDAKILQQKAKNAQLKGRTYVSVKNALRAAKRHSAAQDLIYVGGSTFVVAEVV